MKTSPRFRRVTRWLARLVPLVGMATTLAQLPPSDGEVRARSVITVADDFVVEVYHNGQRVPDEQRRMIAEVHGAISERLEIEVRRGDWIVFNVVNNRLRWGGARYFAVTGMLDAKRIGFSSAVDSHWTACDDPKQVDAFIARPGRFSEEPVSKIKRPWADGPKLMKQFAGPTWNGEAIWGASYNTWIKVTLR